MTVTSSIYPSENLNFKVDLKKEFSKHEFNSDKFLTIGRLRSDKKIAVVELRGEMCTAGISNTEFQSGKVKKAVYSIGLTVDEGGEELIAQLVEILVKTCETVSNDWEINEPLKDDNRLYIKLKLDGSGKKFNFKSNLTLTPKKYSDASGAEYFTFKGDVVAWFNFADKKAGLSFVPKSLMFDEDEGEEEETVLPPPKKKVKSE